MINETKYLRQCPYCTYIFFDYHRKDAALSKTAEETPFALEPKSQNGSSAFLLLCPRCHSYINLDENDEKKEF